MKVDNAEKLVQFQMMSQIFKSAVGDSDSFQLIMESLSKAMDVDSTMLNMQDIGNFAVEAKVVEHVNSEVSSGNISIDEAIERASKKYNIDKDFIRAVIKQESSFNPKSTSHAGAMGLMQLMPGTANELGVTNPYDIGQNVDGGTKYLKNLLNMYGNSKEMALSAYNAGMGTLKNRGVKGKEDINKLPFETRDYVQKVMKYYGK